MLQCSAHWSTGGCGMLLVIVKLSEELRGVWSSLATLIRLTNFDFCASTIWLGVRADAIQMMIWRTAAGHFSHLHSSYLSATMLLIKYTVLMKYILSLLRNKCSLYIHVISMILHVYNRLYIIAHWYECIVCSWGDMLKSDCLLVLAFRLI